MVTVLITISATHKEMITYFKDKNHNSKKRYKNYKNSKHNFKISRQYLYHRSNVNFYNSIDYWCWFDFFYQHWLDLLVLYH